MVSKRNGNKFNKDYEVNCNIYKTVYAIICKKKCDQVYNGETQRILNFGLADHRAMLPIKTQQVYMLTCHFGRHVFYRAGQKERYYIQKRKRKIKHWKI